jgi:hypothetical protein
MAVFECFVEKIVTVTNLQPTMLHLLTKRRSARCPRGAVTDVVTTASGAASGRSAGEEVALLATWTSGASTTRCGTRRRRNLRNLLALLDRVKEG